MKTKILACLALASSLLATIAFADSASTASALAAVGTRVPKLFTYAPPPPAPADLIGDDADVTLTLDGSASPAPKVAFTNSTVDGLTKPVAYRDLPDAASLTAKATAARVTYLLPPSPTFAYDAHSSATWYPAVSFRF
jgi:hypothetical protein